MNSKAIRKQLFAAVAMVLVAAVALGSSTYAWFVASGTVEATGMQVTAQAEAGIVISNSLKASFGTTAVTDADTDAKLTPASTADGKTWYHAKSEHYDNADANQAAGKYTQLNNGAGTDGKDYVKNTFYIKSASNSVYNGTLQITKIDVISGGAQELSKALRVGFLVHGATADKDEFYVYAPVSGGTASYTVAATQSVTAKSKDTATNTGITTLPANTADGQQVDIFMWYEGEDEYCNSSKLIQNLETTNITVTFTGVENT